jgi:hypothetical protein
MQYLPAFFKIEHHLKMTYTVRNLSQFVCDCLRYNKYCCDDNRRKSPYFFFKLEFHAK